VSAARAQEGKESGVTEVEDYGHLALQTKVRSDELLVELAK